MDYKKIIAATAVTSAAFVVPVVADAAEPTPIPSTDLLTSSYAVGDVITAPTKVNVNGTDEEIVEYLWVIKYKNSDGTVILGTTNTVTVPLYAYFDTGEIILKVKTASGVFEQSTNEIKYSGIIKTDLIPNDGFVNQRVQAILPNGTFNKFEWYILEPGAARLLKEEKDSVIDIPASASGKLLRLVATAESGEEYIGDLTVTPLVLDVIKTTLKLNGTVLPDSPTLAANDVLSVDIDEIGHSGAVDFLLSDVNITYQWYYTDNNGTNSIIANAEGATFTIPNDAFGRNYENITVAVTADVPNSGASKKTTFSSTVKLTNEAATVLNDNIPTKLFDTKTPVKYKGTDLDGIDTDLDDFATVIQTLQSNYANLSTNSKLIVTNYPKVQKAAADLVVAKAFLKEVDHFMGEKDKYDSDPSELMHSQLVKQFNAIEKKYQKLDSLQRSLVAFEISENYVEAMAQYLGNITEYTNSSSSSTGSTLDVIVEINEDIANLFTEGFTKVKEYDLSNITTRTAFLDEVERIEEEIKKLDKKQQVVINSALLKAAKADVKKANTVAAKIEQIDKNAGAKKVKAILGARTAYNKLTFMQQSLISTDEKASIAPDADSEQSVVDSINFDIGEIADETKYLETDTSILLTDVERLLTEYKTLSSTSKKLVTNYAFLNQVKKDVKAAERVVNQINSAIEAHYAANNLSADQQNKALKSAQSKYRSAYNAYTKLTVLQRSLVAASEQLTEDIDTFVTDYMDLTGTIHIPDDSDPDKEVEFDSSKVDGIVSKLSELEKLILNGSDTIQSAQTLINEIEVKYKAANSAEKKNVYNYSILSMAKSALNKASSVQKTLNTALSSGSVSKMNTAIATYNKLTSGQKGLILEAYNNVETKLNELMPDLSEIEDALETLEETPSSDNLLEVQKLVSSMSNKELKQLSKYTVYQNVLKAQKAVDSFMKKYKKLSLKPTYSQKQSIIKDFKKLTVDQVNYLKNTYSNVLAKIEDWDAESPEAITLNDKIGKLIDVSTGFYSVNASDTVLEELKDQVDVLKASYKALDSKERKLVTHYSFLSKIEKDVKVVERLVVSVKAAKGSTDEITNESTLNTLTRSYNQLTSQQMDLFDKTLIYEFK